ncbi:MAG: hypothetical protein JZU65_19155 [Chlorobium sp.]|nr:hypothetical protein [Chlorobium sp.]
MRHKQFALARAVAIAELTAVAVATPVDLTTFPESESHSDGVQVSARWMK